MHQLGFGTAAIGRPQYINLRHETPEPFSFEAFKQNGRKVLDHAYQQGIRYFDTAPGYGMAEQLLIDWANNKNDDSIEIATKWGYTYVANFDPNAAQHEIKEHSIQKLKEQWKQSKQLLPQLSTYQIHSATFDTGVLENEEVLNHLAELKTAYPLLMGITTSGTGQVELIKKALEIEINGIVLFDAFQVTYNGLDQSLSEIAKELSTNNKRMIIKEALANGRLIPNDRFPHYKSLYGHLQKLGDKYQVGADAIALRFCMDSLHPYSVLSGAATIQHVEQNVKSLSFQLEEDELEMLKLLGLDKHTYWAERKKLAWN